MTNGAKIAVVALLAVAVAATFALRGGKRAEYVAPPEPPAAQGSSGTATLETGPGATQVAAAPAPSVPLVPAPGEPATVPAPGVVTAAAKPRLVEVGSSRCMACIEMAKVLDALRASQGPRLQVDFVDVFEEPGAADRFKISLIPTQILYDTSGKEIFRHTGYYAHDDILAKFRELGVKL